MASVTVFDDMHYGGLTDGRRSRSSLTICRHLGKVTDPNASGFFVVIEGEVQRPLSRQLRLIAGLCNPLRRLNPSSKVLPALQFARC